MKFMTMIKFDETIAFGPPPPALYEAMGVFAEEGCRNGTLVEQGGLRPSEAGAIVSLADGADQGRRRPVHRGKELIGGYAVIEVHSKAEAIELAPPADADPPGQLARLRRAAARSGSCSTIPTRARPRADPAGCALRPTRWSDRRL